MVKYIIEVTCAKKEGSTLLLPITNGMQDARSNSYEQHVSACKHIYTNKFIMITFPEKLSMGVSICVAKKHM